MQGGRLQKFLAARDAASVAGAAAEKALTPAHATARAEGRIGFQERAPALGQQVVGGDGGGEVRLVYSQRHAHEHVLGALHHLPVQPQQVRPLQRLRAIRFRV